MITLPGFTWCPLSGLTIKTVEIKTTETSTWSWTEPPPNQAAIHMHVFQDCYEQWLRCASNAFTFQMSFCIATIIFLFTVIWEFYRSSEQTSACLILIQGKKKKDKSIKSSLMEGDFCVCEKKWVHFSNGNHQSNFTSKSKILLHKIQNCVYILSYCYWT